MNRFELNSYRIAGVTLLSYGVYLIDKPAGFITCGILCLLLGVNWSKVTENASEETTATYSDSSRKIHH